jgi:glycosyltransferase involved in cell wall biosynthesis
MPSAVGTILQKATRKNKQYNILTFSTHERYQGELAKTGHQFYLLHGDGIKKWNKTFGPVPSNHTLLDGSKGSFQIPNDIEFDFILSQSKSHMQVARQLSLNLNIPIVSSELTTPMPQWTNGYIQNLKQHFSGHINVFITEWSRDQWGYSENEAFVIEHAIDSNIFSPDESIPKQPYVLTVANEYPQRDWCLGFGIYQRITKDLPTHPIGDSIGFSKAAESIDDLVREYQTAQVFLNTSTFSPVPTALLEAMSCGCAIVTTASAGIPSVVENGVNGFISNDEGELRTYLQKLLNNPQLCEELGKRARQTVVDRFNIDRFISQWNQIFDKAANLIFIG